MWRWLVSVPCYMCYPVKTRLWYYLESFWGFLHWRRKNNFPPWWWWRWWWWWFWWPLLRWVQQSPESEQEVEVQPVLLLRSPGSTNLMMKMKKLMMMMMMMKMGILEEIDDDAWYKVTEAISKEASIGVAMLGEVNHHQQLEKVFHQRKMKLYKVCPTYVGHRLFIFWMILWIYMINTPVERGSHRPNRNKVPWK